MTTTAAAVEEVCRAAARTASHRMPIGVVEMVRGVGCCGIRFQLRVR